MKIKILSALMIMFATTVSANSSSLNLALPSAPGNYQSDKFRAGDLDCSNAIGSATNLELGVTGIISKGQYDELNRYFNDTQVGDIGVYARITIPLGKRVHNRVDCSKLYDLELRKKQLEVMKLEQELKALRKLQFEE